MRYMVKVFKVVLEKKFFEVVEKDVFKVSDKNIFFDSVYLRLNYKFLDFMKL